MSAERKPLVVRRTQDGSIELVSFAEDQVISNDFIKTVQTKEVRTKRVSYIWPCNSFKRAAFLFLRVFEKHLIRRFSKKLADKIANYARRITNCWEVNILYRLCLNKQELESLIEEIQLSLEAFKVPMVDYSFIPIAKCKDGIWYKIVVHNKFADRKEAGIVEHAILTPILKLPKDKTKILPALY